MLDWLKNKPSKKPSTKYNLIHQFDGLDIPITVTIEKRNGWRSSITNKGVNVRISDNYDHTQINSTIVLAKDWVEKKLIQKGRLRQVFVKKEYKTGDTIKVMEIEITLVVIYDAEQKKHSAKFIDNQTLELLISPSDGAFSENVKKLISKIMILKFKNEFARRVREINEIYFKQKINDIRFKYNHSNWGSCSSSGTLNFSSRLLLAPIDVIDYVIIHELSHLIELNHSDRFWKVVESAMKDYKSKERWLKDHGSSCNF
jgi:predicted metal-dependent hydrolase